MGSKLRFLKKPTIRAHFQCPISLDLMQDPVMLSTGITYDRQSIETWLDVNNNRTCPVTNQILTSLDLTPNHTIRKEIQDWCVANKSLGVERIPTPCVPVTSTQVSEVLTDIELASWQEDSVQVVELVSKIKKWAKESERNRKCISTNGAAKILVTAVGQFNSDTAVCIEVLSTLTCLFPLNGEACKQIATPEVLKSIVSIFNSGHLEARSNATLLMKEVAADKDRASVLIHTEGLVEGIAKLIKEPVSPRTTKASLLAVYYLVASNGHAVTKFVDLGLVSVLLETIVDAEKSICEKALGVLDAFLSNEKAREVSYVHALLMPVLIKKMFRISEMTTEFAVSALWKLFKNCEEEDRRKSMAEAALSVGAFQKLLLLLQLGCSLGIKEKASELLKTLNACRGKGECIESDDFKGLKRNL